MNAKTILDNAIYKIGDTIRIKKGLNENIGNIKEFLGKKCIIKEINVLTGFISDPKIEYVVEYNNRLEPFWEYELDIRYKPQTKYKNNFFNI